MKFQPGENRFRIVARPVLGVTWWVGVDGEVREKGDKPQKGDKAVRVRKGDPITMAAQSAYKKFQAYVVYNYAAKRLQVLEITQKGIQEDIVNLARDTDWGSPIEYDLQVVKKGEGMETAYFTAPKPKSEMDDEIKELLKTTNFNLDALFDGGQVFGGSTLSNEEIEKVDVDDLPF
jgi:hypothetical protein